MTTVKSLLTKKREITSGTKEWADYNVNCIKGCSNNCRYCYAKMMAKRFGRCGEDNWGNMIINQNAVNKEYGKYKGRVMFPSSHDIVDKPNVKKVCYTVIRKLLEAENEVLITTKPNYTVTKDLVNKFHQYLDQIQFRFTITSLNNNKLAFWEPNAPLYEERLQSLEYAFNNDFKTSVSIEPFLDHEPQRLVSELSPFVTESIWIGPMNYIPRNNIPEEYVTQYDEIRSHYEQVNLSRIYQDLHNHPQIRFKDSMAMKLNIPTVHKIC